MFKNMKIGPRMILAFTVIIILSIALAVLSITQLNTVAQQTEDLYNRPMQVISNSKDIEIDLNMARALTLETIVNTDPQKMAEAEEAANASGDEITVAVENLTAIFQGDETTDRLEMIESFTTLLNEAAPTRKQAIALAQEGRNDEATDIYLNQYLALYTELDEIAMQIGDSAQTNAEIFYKDSQTLSRSALIMIIVIAAVQIIGAVVIALILTRSIIRPLNLVKNVAEQVGAGHINIKIDHQSKDEMGDLANTFRSVIQTLNLLNGEMKQLKDWATEGRILERSGDKEQIQGAYRDIVHGVNGIMDTFVNHYHAMPVGASIVDTANHQVFANKVAESHRLIAQENLQTQTQSLTDESGKTVGSLIVTVDQTLVREAQRESEQQAQAVEKAMQLAEKRSAYQKLGIDIIIESINQLAKGDLSIYLHDAPFDEDTKELHDMFYSLEKSLVDSCGNIKGYIDELAQILGSIADRNLNVGITREYMGDFAALKTSINNITDTLNQIFGEIAGATNQVQGGSQQVADSSQTLAQGASEQASAVQQISATVAEVAAQTRNNAENANKANEISLSAKTDAETGSKQMDEMVNAMEAIKEASKGIAGIIKAIEDIAFQTNILALNAAVEAARAGEHGKGFAVVAEEVRTLAARSAAAAKETTEMIDNSLAKVEIGSKIAGDTAEALAKIVSGVTGTVDIVATIAEASAQQATAIAQIDDGVEQISKVTQSNTATAEESASASEEMAGQAQILQTMIGEFTLKGQKTKLTGPKESIRALKSGAERNAGYESPPAPHSQETDHHLDIDLDGDFGKY